MGSTANRPGRNAPLLRRRSRQAARLCGAVRLCPARSGRDHPSRRDRGGSPVESAGAAHAGCLSFELSTGGAPLVVNVGSPGGLRSGPRRRTPDGRTFERSHRPGLRPVSCRRGFRAGRAMAGRAARPHPDRGTERRHGRAQHGRGRARSLHRPARRLPGAFGVTHERAGASRRGGALEGQDRLSGRPLRDRTERPSSVSPSPSVRCRPPARADLDLMRAGARLALHVRRSRDGWRQHLLRGVAGWSPDLPDRGAARGVGCAVAATWRFERVLPAPGDLDDRSL
jgi:hypothetical protein